MYEIRSVQILVLLLIPFALGLYGEVYDSDNNPIEGATVKIIWHDDNGLEYIDTFTTLTYEEAVELGNVALVGHFNNIVDLQSDKADNDLDQNSENEFNFSNEDFSDLIEKIENDTTKYTIPISPSNSSVIPGPYIEKILNESEKDREESIAYDEGKIYFGDDKQESDVNGVSNPTYNYSDEKDYLTKEDDKYNYNFSTTYSIKNNVVTSQNFKDAYDLALKNTFRVLFGEKKKVNKISLMDYFAQRKKKSSRPVKPPLFSNPENKDIDFKSTIQIDQQKIIVSNIIKGIISGISKKTWNIILGILIIIILYISIHKFVENLHMEDLKRAIEDNFKSDIDPFIRKPLVTASSDDYLPYTLRIMNDYQTDTIIVVDNGKYRGILTYKRILNKVKFYLKPDNIKVKDIMDIYFEPLEKKDCMFIDVLSKKYSIVPIVEKEKLIGYISHHEILRHMISEDWVLSLISKIKAKDIKQRLNIIDSKKPAIEGVSKLKKIPYVTIRHDGDSIGIFTMEDYFSHIFYDPDIFIRNPISKVMRPITLKVPVDYKLTKLIDTMKEIEKTYVTIFSDNKPVAFMRKDDYNYRIQNDPKKFLKEFNIDTESFPLPKKMVKENSIRFIPLHHRYIYITKNEKVIGIVNEEIIFKSVIKTLKKYTPTTFKIKNSIKIIKEKIKDF